MRLRPRLLIALSLGNRTLVPLNPAPSELNRPTNVLRDLLCTAFGALLAAELAWSVELTGFGLLMVSVLLLCEVEPTCSSAGLHGVMHCRAGSIKYCTELG